MSCYACTRKYGFFCKESGCPNCNYSFCTKCLKKEIEVPKLKNRKCKVCLKCFEILSKLKEQSEYLKIENSKQAIVDSQVFAITEPYTAPVLEPLDPAEEAIPPESESLADNEIKQNLDIEIKKRLDNLKTELPSGSSDKSMSQRLASLKDENYKEYNNKDILISKDKRTDQEKIKDLLKQFVEENEIDQKAEKDLKIDPVADIERRLAALRDKDVNSLKTEIPKDESMNVSKIVKKYLDEAKLPDLHGGSLENEVMDGLPKPSDNPELEELPFCVICNEDANIRCLGCDNDLYCRSCFKEIHNDEEYRLHNTQNYKIPPKFKENHF